MSGAFIHHLDPVLPSNPREFTLNLEFRELCLIIRVRDRARSETIAK